MLFKDADPSVPAQAVGESETDPQKVGGDVTPVDVVVVLEQKP